MMVEDQTKVPRDIFSEEPYSNIFSKWKAKVENIFKNEVDGNAVIHSVIKNLKEPYFENETQCLLIVLCYESNNTKVSFSVLIKLSNASSGLRQAYDKNGNKREFQIIWCILKKGTITKIVFPSGTTVVDAEIVSGFYIQANLPNNVQYSGIAATHHLPIFLIDVAILVEMLNDVTRKNEYRFDKISMYKRNLEEMEKLW